MNSSQKRNIKFILCYLKLLGLLDYLLFVKDYLLSWRANRVYINKGNLCMPADLCWDAYNTTNLELIDRLGELHFVPFLSILDRTFTSMQRPLKIFEWGAGPGRLLLQFDRYRQQSLRPIELFGSDFNEKSVSFMSENVPQIDYRLNSIMPPLGFFLEKFDGFDYIYAFSVFTHLNETAFIAWVTELLGLLSPGGIFCFTVNGDFISSYLGGIHIKMYDRGEYVYFPGSSLGKKNSISHVSRAYVENCLPEGFELFEFIPGGLFEAFSQDLFAIKRCTSFIR